MLLVLKWPGEAQTGVEHPAVFYSNIRNPTEVPAVGPLVVTFTKTLLRLSVYLPSSFQTA